MKPSTFDEFDRPASVQVVATQDRGWVPFLAAGLGAGVAAGAFLLGLQFRDPPPPPVVIPIVQPAPVTPTPTPVVVPQVPAARPQAELVFVIDTTGSMGGLLRAARQKAWSIVDALATAQVDLRVGLVAFRDRGDEYVTRVTPLTGDVDRFYEALHGLRAIGGGDTPEAIAEALRAAKHEAGWSADPSVRRLIVLIGDAPPRGDAPGRAEAAAALAQGIAVSTVRIGDDLTAAEAFAAIAAAGGGSALHVRPLAQGRLSEQVVTPLDDAIAAAQRRVEATVVPFGTAAQQQALSDQSKLMSSLGREEYAARASWQSKTGRFYERDLIDALDAGRLKLADVRPEHLPAGTSLANLDALRAERQAARDELAGLVARRDAWLASNARRTGVDGQLLDCIERHLAR